MQRKLVKLFYEAVSSVNSGNIIRATVKLDPVKNELNIGGEIFDSNLKFHVIGFGKAVLGMAEALEDILQHRIVNGVLCVPFIPPNFVLPKIKLFTGAENNLPDEKSVRATDEIIQLASTVPKKDIVLVLISGGGSSLLCKPIPEISLQDKILTIKQLVACGADIRELNTVRKTLSIVKGGGLAKIFEGRKIISLVLSDVVGNPMDLIASGPTVPKNDSKDAALEVIQKYKLEMKIPKHVMKAIRNPKEILYGEESSIKNLIIGSNDIALKCALKFEGDPRLRKIFVSSSVQGLVTNVAQAYLKIALEILQYLHSKNVNEFFGNLRLWARECSGFQIESSFIQNLAEACQNNLNDGVILLFGGETTTLVSGTGKGGRNQELAVTFAKTLHEIFVKRPEIFENWDVTLLCAGTDGIDGPTDAAGAVGCRDLIINGIQMGLNVSEFLGNNDSYSYLSAINRGAYLIKTGHTGTNVMDVHFLAIHKRSETY